MFVDLSVISQHDAGTGIQRVVRSLALELAKQTSNEFEIVFVASSSRQPYRAIAWPDGRNDGATQVKGKPGDVFVGLDYSLDAIRAQRRQLRAFRRDGGELWFLVHDLLPLRHPEWFSPNTVIRYRSWLGIIAGIADGFLCNSDQTRSELQDVLATHFGLTKGYEAHVLPMGFNIQSPEANPLTIAPRIDINEPFFLMVGTIEPRKGHGDIVAAFDRLWCEGFEKSLVLIGRKGWQVDALCEQIRNHPKHGNKLFWFDDVEDAELAGFYQACCGVIISSYAEGFGLPLLEALGYSKPVLARDIPVFHNFAENGVRHFPNEADCSTLMSFIQGWAADLDDKAIKIVPPVLCWSESAQALMSAVVARATCGRPAAPY